jgi:hypothetical protein
MHLGLGITHNVPGLALVDPSPLRIDVTAVLFEKWSVEMKQVIDQMIEA